MSLNFPLLKYTSYSQQHAKPVSFQGNDHNEDKKTNPIQLPTEAETTAFRSNLKTQRLTTNYAKEAGSTFERDLRILSVFLGLKPDFLNRFFTEKASILNKGADPLNGHDFLNYFTGEAATRLTPKKCFELYNFILAFAQRDNGLLHPGTDSVVFNSANDPASTRPQGPAETNSSPNHFQVPKPLPLLGMSPRQKIVNAAKKKEEAMKLANRWHIDTTGLKKEEVQNYLDNALQANNMSWGDFLTKEKDLRPAEHPSFLIGANPNTLPEYQVLNTFIRSLTTAQFNKIQPKIRMYEGIRTIGREHYPPFTDVAPKHIEIKIAPPSWGSPLKKLRSLAGERVFDYLIKDLGSESGTFILNPKNKQYERITPKNGFVKVESEQYIKLGEQLVLTLKTENGDEHFLRWERQPTLKKRH